MVVSFVSHSANMAGAERALLDTIDIIQEMGFFAHVVLPGHGPLEQELIKRNVIFDIVNLPWWANIGESDIEQVNLAIRESSLILASRLKKINPDIIYTSTSVIAEGALAAKILGIPHIWNISEFGKEEHGVKYMLDESERMKFISNYSEKIFFVSEALMKSYLVNIEKEKLAIVPNLVQVDTVSDVHEKYFTQNDSLKMIIIGSIIAGKAQLDAVRASIKLHEQNKNVELIVIGRVADPEYYDELQEAIKEASVQNKVKFVDYSNNVSSFIQQADVVLVCSTHEGFGRVTVEGMLLNKPVIGANSGATPELIMDGINGFLYEPGDYADLAKKIEYFVDNKEEIVKFGQKGNDFANANFNKQKHIEKLLKEFMEVKKIKKEAAVSFEGIEEIVNDIEQRKMELLKKDQEIQDLRSELNTVKSSKFWKVRGLYLKLKFAVRSPKKFAKKYLSKISYLINASIISLQNEGAGVVIKRAINFILHGKGVISKDGIRQQERNIAYENWIRNIEKPLKKEISSKISANIKAFTYKPIISIVLPVYNSDEIFLRKAIFSVINQSYENWELCIIDDKSTKKIIKKILNEFTERDQRIKVAFQKENGGISIATNKAVEMATGEFIGFLDHDDEMEQDALFEIVSELNRGNKLDFIYSDDDKVDENGFRYDPQFKPDWSPELLLSYCYVSHFRVVRKSLFVSLGGFKKEFDGSQDYEFMLRLSEKTDRVSHIAKILYHWRSLPGSVARSAGEKPLSIERGRKAVQNAIERRGIKGEVVQPLFAEKSNLGIYKIKFKSADFNEKVTIIIPTKDNVELLKKCISSIRSKTNYKNYEILVINNNSVENKTYEYLKKENIQYIDIKNGYFNFSEINNIAVGKVQTELILFMNNDTEVISSDWLLEMVGTMSLDSKIGAVGARLIYDDKKIQHAGIILGVNGFSAGHANKLLHFENSGYLSYNLAMRNYSAVTAACLLTKKSIFMNAGGFDDINLKVAYNDVDYCLKLLTSGYRIVYNPDALLYHHEGKTRGFVDDIEELKFFKNKWHDLILRDPFFNINLSLNHEQFRIKEKK